MGPGDVEATGAVGPGTRLADETNHPIAGVITDEAAAAAEYQRREARYLESLASPEGPAAKLLPRLHNTKEYVDSAWRSAKGRGPAPFAWIDTAGVFHLNAMRVRKF